MATVRKNLLLITLLVILLIVAAVYESRPSVDQQALNTLNAARTAQHIVRFIPPKNFQSMSSAEQVALIINDERSAHNEPVGQLGTIDQGFIQTALDTNADPEPITNVPGVKITGTVWGWTSIDSIPYSLDEEAAVEHIDYSWVYHDGWLGAQTTNADCTSPHAAGCQGHRRNILEKNPPGTTLIILAGEDGHILEDGHFGSAAAAELIFTTKPALFHPVALP